MTSPINSDMTLAELVGIWLVRLRAEGRLEAATINEYERVLRKLVVPALGDDSISALTTDGINEVLARLGAQSTNRQRKAKVIAGAMLDAAVADGAIAVNPVRGSLSVSRPKTAPRTLTLADLEAARDAVRTWMTKDRPGPKSSDDLADIIDLMLATGARIGEVLAIRWSDIDLHARQVVINATIKTETAKGTYRKTLPTSRTLGLTTFGVEVLRRREQHGRRNELDAVFATRNDTWHQVNNVERRWRQIRAEAGLEWVTPDAFRALAR
ncbi:MAG: tyrosine-type recombinase/integrase [Propionibacteriales bacterium]|nr:tyrosine-type recombinase/integrase [Propionibacteriales bacterium]